MGCCALEELHKTAYDFTPVLGLKPRHVLQYELLQAVAPDTGYGIIFLADAQR